MSLTDSDITTVQSMCSDVVDMMGLIIPGSVTTKLHRVAAHRADTLQNFGLLCRFETVKKCPLN